MRIEVYGASDDLVEVDGDVTAEFNVYLEGDEPAYLGVSCGTLLRVTYDGLWHINVMEQGTAKVSHRAATNGDDDYSDRVVVEADVIDWVVFGSGWATPILQEDGL